MRIRFTNFIYILHSSQFVIFSALPDWNQDGMINVLDFHIVNLKQFGQEGGKFSVK